MAAQSLAEQGVRDRFADALRTISRPTPLQSWLANVRVPAASCDALPVAGTSPQAASDEAGTEELVMQTEDLGEAILAEEVAHALTPATRPDHADEIQAARAARVAEIGAGE